MKVLEAASVRRALPWDALVAVLRQAFTTGCEVPPRQAHAIGLAGTALVMPAWRSGGYLGVKTVTIFPDNAALGLPSVHAIYTLFSATTGEPLAVMDGGELTARRTAAASALAADFLARPDVTRLALVGAGRVASLMPGALRSVRPGLTDVVVWSRQPESAEQLVTRLCSQGFAARASTDLQAAVRQAHVVSCATLAMQPLVQGAWLASGTHLDLIGSFTPAMREADGNCFARSRVFVDTEEALTKSGDVLQAVAEGHFQTQAVQGTLAALCRGEAMGRHAAAEITLFKSVGTALEDLAGAGLALHAADNPLLPD